MPDIEWWIGCTVGYILGYYVIGPALKWAVSVIVERFKGE